MADGLIGALRVLLGVDTAAFSAGLDGAEGQVKKFANSLSDGLGKASLAAGAAIAAMATGISVAVKSSINEMDNLSKLSQKIGVPIEKLSALKLAADLSDVSVEALGKSMSKMSSAMVAAAAGGTGPAASAFQALGISMKTLKSNDPSAVMEVIGQRFSQMQDGATKTALANAIFGQRMGRELIPLLNQGADGLKRAREEAEAFGLVVSEKTGRQAEDFNDNLKRMGAMVQGVGNVMAEKLLPILVELTNRFVAWAKENDVVRVAADALLRVIALVADNMVFLGKVIAVFIAVKLALFFVQLALQIYEFSKALYAAATAGAVLNTVLSKNVVVTVVTMTAALLYASGALDGFMDKMKEFAAKAGVMLPNIDIGGKISAGLAAIGFNVRALGGNLDGLKAHGDEAGKALSTIKPPPAFDPSSSANATKFADEIKKIELRAREVRGAFDQLAPGFIQAATSLKLIKETGDGFTGTLATLTPQQMQLNQALWGMEAAKIAAANLTPWQEYEKQMVKLNEMHKALKLSTEEFEQAGAKAAATMIETYGKAIGDMLGSFSDLAKTLGKGNKEMFIVGKALAISQAIINVLVGVTKAIAQGGVLGIAMGATVLAAGMATVAKIIAEKPPTGMALGGSMQVSGAGGIDSQMVPIMATPGERVTIDQNKYGDTSQSARTLTIQGIKPKDYYTGDVLRDFVENLNQAIGDGLKIKMA